VIRFQPCSPPACTVLSTASQSAERLASWLPICRFLRPMVQSLKARRSLCSVSGTMPPARNGLSLACNGCLSPDHHSRVNVPGLLLRLLALGFHSPFGSQAPLPGSVCPNPGRFSASKPVAASASGSPTGCPSFHSPSGFLHPSGSKRSTGAPPGGLPSDYARSPLAPRRPQLFY